jgi:hypothetical protein
MPGTSRRTIDWRTILRARGLLSVGIAVAVAFSGLALTSTTSPAEDRGPHITVDGSTYAVGSAGDDVALLQAPCDPQARVLLLDRDTATVWAFGAVAPDAHAVPIAIVPGATDLRAERVGDGDDTCDVAVARGPAGAVVIDTRPR